MEDSIKQNPLNALVLLIIGITLIFLAVLLIILGLFLTLHMDVKGGAFFLIGPFPLLLTFDSPTFWLVIVLLILLILAPLLIVMAWLRRIGAEQAGAGE